MSIRVERTVVGVADVDRSHAARDVVLACNMGDFIFALPTLARLNIRTLALPPYLVHLATALWGFIKPVTIRSLPDDRLNASNAKGMLWRSLRADELSSRFGLTDPLNLSMRGNHIGHIINRIAASAEMSHQLPMRPPLENWAVTSLTEDRIAVLVQAECWTEHKRVTWFDTTDWPAGSAQLDTGQPFSGCPLPKIKVSLSSMGLIETANLIRKSELVVSVSSFTGILSAAMGVSTIMVHRGSRPQDCGVSVFGQHDIHHEEKAALTTLLSSMSIRTHRSKPKVPNMAALIPVHTDMVTRQEVGCAHIIGNGESRRGFDLKDLSGRGTMFGCNALYRDIWPDFLICVDPSMRGEIANKSTYPKERVVFRYRDRGFASGPCAVSVASDRGHNPIYLLGFDCQWSPHKTVHDGADVPAINNVYKGTNNYAGPNNPVVHTASWVEHITKVMDEHPDTTYYQVGVHSLQPSSTFDEAVNKILQRVISLTYEEFKAMLERPVQPQADSSGTCSISS